MFDVKTEYFEWGDTLLIGNKLTPSAFSWHLGFRVLDDVPLADKVTKSH